MDELEQDATLPPGYAKDGQGHVVHTQYDADVTGWCKGVTIPSCKPEVAGGGSYGFDPNSPDIPQNIVEYTPQGDRVITQMTRADIARKQGVQLPAQEVPAAAPFQGQSAGAVGVAVGHIAVSLSNQGGDMAKRAGRKKSKKQSADPESPSRARESVPTPPQTVAVTISGPFGKIIQQFSAVFVDNGLIVLATDHRQLPAAYQFPVIQDEQPLAVDIGWGTESVHALWAGIQFTLPDYSATFSVLFLNEEPAVSEDPFGAT